MSIDSETFQQLLTRADAEFVRRSAERLQGGAKKYGPFKFLTVDTVEEAMQEALDISNYGRMIFIKLFLLQYSIAQMQVSTPMDDQGFIAMKDVPSSKGQAV